MLAAHPPPRAEDAHKSIAAMARAITAPGGSYDRFQESPQLQAMRRAAHRMAHADPASRTAWKAVSRARKLATATWKRGKATGPDGIAHEALTAMMGDDSWKQRMQYLLNDFLYRGALPPQVAAGVTVLLPKTPGSPAGWGDTRPITLSSAVLKWFAQLLLLRGAPTPGRGCAPVGAQRQAGHRTAGRPEARHAHGTGLEGSHVGGQVGYQEGV